MQSRLQEMRAIIKLIIALGALFVNRAIAETYWIDRMSSIKIRSPPTRTKAPS